MKAYRMARTLAVILAAASVFASCGGGKSGGSSITAPKSSNAKLKSIVVSDCGDVFVDFSPETLSYGPYKQGNETASYTVSVEKEEDGQTVTIGGSAGLESTGKLLVGLNTVTVEVTAEDGVTKQAYS